MGERETSFMHSNSSNNSSSHGNNNDDEDHLYTHNDQQQSLLSSTGAQQGSLLSPSSESSYYHHTTNNNNTTNNNSHSDEYVFTEPQSGAQCTIEDPITLTYDKPPFLGSTRCVIIVCLWLANVVCYCDRINISVAILHMSKEMNWTPSQEGYILGAFFYGYILTQIPGGKMAQKYGSSPVLRGAVLIWSAFTLLTPLAARSSLWFLYIVRFGMGFGEGAALPAIHAALGRWVPISERTRCVTFVTSGQLVGTVLALGSSPITARNWPAVFYFFGLLGIVWAIVATLFLSSSPETHPRITQRERAYIITSREDTSSKTEEKSKAPNANIQAFVNHSCCTYFCHDSPHTPLHARPLPVWYRLILQAPMLAAFAALVTHNWGWYILLSWMPKYLNVLGADAANVGLYALLPYVLMFIADNSWGAAVDHAINAGMPVIGARRLSQGIALVGPAMALLVLVLIDDPSLGIALVMLSIAVTCSSCTHAGVWANVIDLGPNHAGYLLGLVNTVGNLPGLIGNITTGWILEASGSWGFVFAVAVAVYMVGFVIYTIWSQARILYL